MAKKTDHHKHSWQYPGRVIKSTDREVEGLFGWDCADSSCHASLYSEHVNPAGKIIIRESARRFSNDAEKQKRKV